MTAATLELDVERPVAGGRMLARHDGRVVFVSGAIPGERVRVLVERIQKNVAFARTLDVLRASPDRRTPPCDLDCGGSAYGHIAYARQLAIKSAVIGDAFARIAKHALPAPVSVAASPEQGYRVRARLHVGADRWGFVREGTHELCDAAATGQLQPAAVDAVTALYAAAPDLVREADAILLNENVAGTERALHVVRPSGTFDDGASLASADLARVGVTGVSAGPEDRPFAVLLGDPRVHDAARDLCPGAHGVNPSTRWTRGPMSFFQANRFLVGALVERVLAAAQGDDVVDLYSGVGLLAVALAARGARVTAVEGAASSSADLRENAAPFGDRLRVEARSVEDAVAERPSRVPAVVVLDPPRTGVSPDALSRLAPWRTPRIVYVSCDPPTLARDAGRLLAAGYVLASIDALDLFPNTPHVETIAVFDLSGGETPRGLDEPGE